MNNYKYTQTSTLPLLLYSGTGFENVYVRDAPAMLTHSVNGSVPICSCVAPVMFSGVEGTVTGMVVPHLLPPAVYTVMLSMPEPSALIL